MVLAATAWRERRFSETLIEASAAMLARKPIVRLAVSIACAAFISSASLSPAAAQVSDYLGVPGPIQFDGKPYKLVWSSRPTSGYAKQEYLTSDQSIGSYTQI